VPGEDRSADHDEIGTSDRPGIHNGKIAGISGSFRIRNPFFVRPGLLAIRVRDRAGTTVFRTEPAPPMLKVLAMLRMLLTLPMLKIASAWFRSTPQQRRG